RRMRERHLERYQQLHCGESSDTGQILPIGDSGSEPEFHVTNRDVLCAEEYLWPLAPSDEDIDRWANTSSGNATYADVSVRLPHCRHAFRACTRILSIAKRARCDRGHAGNQNRQTVYPCI